MKLTFKEAQEKEQQYPIIMTNKEGNFLYVIFEKSDGVFITSLDGKSGFSYLKINGVQQAIDTLGLHPFKGTITVE